MDEISVLKGVSLDEAIFTTLDYIADSMSQYLVPVDITLSKPDKVEDYQWEHWLWKRYQNRKENVKALG